MRRTMFLLMALAAVSSEAAVLCTAKSGSGTVRVRTTCRRRERQLDPAALDLQGPPGRGTAFEASADTPPGSPSPLDDEFNNPSVDGKWSWVNQGSATIAASPNGYTTLTVTPTNGDNWRMRVQSKSGSFTVTMRYASGFPMANYAATGFVFRNSSTGKFTSYGFGYNSGPNILVQRFNDPTTFSFTAINFGLTTAQYLKATSDGTTLTFYASLDGAAWTRIGTETIATHIGTLDQIGFGVDCNNNGATAFDTVLYWFRVA